MEALGINVAGLLTQLVSFSLLVALLWVLLYKPVTRALDERSRRIKESLETADRVRQEAAESQAAMEQQNAEAREEGQRLIAQAREVADRFREEEIAKARQDIEAERVRAEANIQRERDAAIEDLRREFAGLAIAAAERVIERSLNEDDHKALINSVLEQGARANRN
jgi:F-type H+-transporting ATPase subunit b